MIHENFLQSVYLDLYQHIHDQFPTLNYHFVSI